MSFGSSVLSARVRAVMSSVVSTYPVRTAPLGRNRSGPLLPFAATVLLIAGCGCTSTGNGFVSAGSFSVGGVVTGASQPIANAEVHLYAVDAQASPASVNKELASAVRTDSHGLFQFPGSVACPSRDALIYLESKGGAPAVSGIANPSVTLLNSLGACSELSSRTTATVNELTTVGSAWPLAVFANDDGQFLPGSSGSDLFSAAIKAIGKLVNSDSGTTPGRLLASGEAAPISAINSLANLISACVVSNGGSAGDGSPCGQLFALAGSDAATQPQNTLAAVLLIAKNPTRNVSALYSLATTRTLFKPSLTSAPEDWALGTKSAASVPVATGGVAASPTSSVYDNGSPDTAVAQTTVPAVGRATAQDTPLVASTIVIKTGGTYQGNWVSTDPTIPAVSIQTDQPVIIQNSTVAGRGNLITVTGSAGANLTLQNVTGTGLDPLVAGKARGAFLVAYIMKSLIVQNCTMTGTQFGIKLGFSTATSIKVLNNQAINLEDRASDGNGGFQAARPQLGHFVFFYQVVAPNGAEVGWNQMVQTMGQSSIDNGIDIFKSQGTSATPILVHDNYVEGMSSPAAATYGASGYAATGDTTSLESTFINFFSNQVVHTAGAGLTISNGHDVTAAGNRVVSCGQNSAGVWYTKAGVYAVVLWNKSNSPSFFDNSITTTAGGLLVPNAASNPVVADSSANPVDLQNASNSVSGNQFADPCLVGGVVTLSAEDTERAFWTNKLSTNAETIGDQHGPVAVTITPATIALSAAQTQQFGASVAWASNTAVTWAISPSVGTISSTGLYTAPSPVATQQTVTVTATSAQDSTRTSTATITLNPPVSVSVTPASAIVLPSATQQFTATVLNTTNTAVTWSMAPAVGTLSAGGLYTAPAVAAGQTITITATSAADTTKTATAVVTLSAPVSVSITPAAVTVMPVQSQQFTATVTNATNTAVTWSMNPSVGTLSAAGFYTAPANGTTAGQQVTITATSVADTTKSASAVVTLNPPISVAVSPASSSLVLSQAQQLAATVSNAANMSVTWSISPAVGSISPGGIYTAPSALASLTTITATATSVVDPTKAGSATITVDPTPVIITPYAVSLYASGTQQYTTQAQGTANQAIVWSVNPSVGTISTSGLYTAPASVTSQQSITVTAYSSGLGKYNTARVTLLPPVKVNLYTGYFVDTVNQTSQFSAQVLNTSNTAVTWSISPSAGTVSVTGLYTAPSAITAQQTITFTATSVADPTKSASGSVVLNPPVKVTLSPASVSLLSSATQQFTANVAWSSNTAVTWSMSPSLGTLTSAGLYTAPSTISPGQSVVVTATSVADPTKAATATVTLNSGSAVVVSPGTAAVTLGQTQLFTAVVSLSNTAVTWSVNPAIGSVTTAGRYSPPTTAVTSPQTVTVTATSVADASKFGSATITVNPPVAVSVSPTTTSLYASQTQQFTPSVLWNSNTAVTYAIAPAVGSISATGLYTAPSSITAQQTVSVTVSSSADSTKYVSAGITLLPPVKVNISSANYFVDTVNQTSQFTAQVLNTSNGAVTWAISPSVGTISPTGLYTAPSTISAQQTIVVTATSVADATKTATGSVVLNPPVMVAVVPTAVTLLPSASQQFVANVAWTSNTAVTWSMSPSLGTLSSSGVYTAPSNTVSVQGVVITATSVADTTKSATAMVTLNPPVSVSVTPATANVTLNQTQLYTATVLNTANSTVSWSITPAIGSISSGGRYAPPTTAVTSPQTVMITATSVVDTTAAASATVTVNPPVAISVAPTTTSLYASQTQQFTPTVLWNPNTTVTYLITPSVGSMSSTGLYTAPSSITAQQSVVVTASSNADPSKYVSVRITLLPPIKVNITSSNYFIDTVSQTNQFTAQVQNTSNNAVIWSISPAVGTISPTGLYAAPSTIAAQQTVTITATSVADPTQSAIGSVLLNPPVSVILVPGNVTLITSHSQQFTANVSWTANPAVTWSMSPSAGTLDSNGLYTAPATINTSSTLTVTATSVADPTKFATATVNLMSTIGPAPLTITQGGTYSGNWISNDPNVPAVTVATDQPVIIQNSTVQGRGNLIHILGTSGANVTVQNVTGTGLDPQVAGLERGAFIRASIVSSLSVLNNTMTGTSFGVLVISSPNLASLSVLRNRGINLEDRASDGNGGFTTTRPSLGHFIQLTSVIAASGAEIGWNQLNQTIGQSSTEDGINLYNSQGASGFPILVHDNYLEGYSSSTATAYTGNGLVTDGDASGLTAYVMFQANDMVHAAGGGVALAAGHDNSGAANRVVSCGKDSSGNWYSQLGATATGIVNFYGSSNFNNNTITTTAGGLVSPDINGLPVASDLGPPVLTGNNTNAGNQFTDPCLVNGNLNLAAEDDERAYWANKLTTNNVVLGDQH